MNLSPICSLSSHEKKPRVFVLALGGTIGSTAPNIIDEFYARSHTHINDLISTLPFNEKGPLIQSEQFFHKISHEMTKDDLLAVAKKIDTLAKNADIDGIVVTQGTNVIEETAYFISLVIQTNKPIVFTGSLRPLNALGYDGSRNLYNAIVLASSKDVANQGVVLTFDDHIFSARYACKLNPASVNGFSIHESSVIGYVESQRIHIRHSIQTKHTLQSEFNIAEVCEFPKIYIIYGHLDMDSIFINAAVAHRAEGIVSAGMGKGYFPKQAANALREACEAGVVVVRCSRTGYGSMGRDAHYDDPHGFIVAGTISPQKASILLAVALSKTKDKKEIQRIFDQY